MKKRLDEFIDFVQEQGMYDINKVCILMHPTTMYKILEDIGCEKVGRIDFYKGWRIAIDPAVPIDAMYTKYYY